MNKCYSFEKERRHDVSDVYIERNEKDITLWIDYFIREKKGKNIIIENARSKKEIDYLREKGGKIIQFYSHDVKKIDDIQTDLYVDPLEELFHFKIEKFLSSNKYTCDLFEHEIKRSVPIPIRPRYYPGSPGYSGFKESNEDHLTGDIVKRKYFSVVRQSLLTIV